MTGYGPKVYPPSTGGGGGGGIGDPNIPDSVINFYSEVAAVPSGVEATVLTYLTVGATPTHLVRAEFSGTNIGIYRLYIDNVLEAQSATWFNGPMSDRWEFGAGIQGLELNPGQTIKITAQHGRPHSGDYWARLTLIRVDA